MRALVFIIPFFISLYYILRDRQDLAFLNVYLPCLFLLPDYYSFRIPHLPPESAASWALVPLAGSLLFYPIPQLQIRRMDLWVTLYALSLTASELFREPSPKDGFVILSSWMSSVYFAYIAGRRMIEPKLRVATVQRIVLLFVLMTPLIIYEYIHRNPWIMMASHLHLDVTASVQLRSGRPRVQASFGHAILAGIVFFIVVMLNHFLSFLYKKAPGKLSPIAGRLERYHMPALLLLLFLFLTQSRGPMMCVVPAYAILQIPKFRNFKSAAFVIVIILAICGSIAYGYLDRYTNVTDNGNLSEEQQSAMYRRELMKNYRPLVEQGGWLGWGALNVPHAEGQYSIDNGYLLIELSQGKLGFYLLLLIIAEALGTTAFCAFSFESSEARVLSFCLLAAMMGLFLSLTAVFMGTAVGPTCFLLLGWSQSLQDEVHPVSKFQFKRVFV